MDEQTKEPKFDRVAAGHKAKQTILDKYGKDYYEQLGRKGGSRTGTKPNGFSLWTHEQRVAAGHKGGSAKAANRRTKKAPAGDTEDL